ncbi:MAG: MaoC family dehydratase [Acetobacteraceae bacterium]
MSDTHASLPPPSPRYFEDFSAGQVFEFGRIEVGEADALQFASRYDPQSIHIDKNAARAGPFGGLILSGWHTCALMMRLFAEHVLDNASSLGSPGIDELRWLKPVRPGDTLSLRVTVEQARRSRSKPDRGMVWNRIEVLNQRDETVMTLKPMNLMRCRQQPEAAP